MKTFFSSAAWQGEKQTDAPRLPECGKCGLYKSGCLSPKMEPTGRGDSSILFVAEAPGEREDIKGRQLVGKSGKLVRQVLRSLGYDLEDGTKTNAVICRPPGNKIEDLYINSCRPNLLKTVRMVKPTVIVLLGGAAVKGLLPTEREADVGGIGRWVGWTIPSLLHGAWICPTYHPSYLLRSHDPVLDRLFKSHLKKAISLENKPITVEPLSALEKKVERITDTCMIHLRLKDLSRKRGLLAFDYEANCLKPDDPKAKIVAVSFCLNGEDTFACRVSEEHYPAIGEVLRNPKLRCIASNLKNEERWTQAKMGHGVASWDWDTMLASHFLDNRGGISSIKFQAFVRFGVSDYDRVVHPYFQDVDKNGFNAVESCPVDDLLLYNGLDSLLEFMVSEVQKKEAGFKS